MTNWTYHWPNVEGWYWLYYRYLTENENLENLLPVKVTIKEDKLLYLVGGCQTKPIYKYDFGTSCASNALWQKMNVPKRPKQNRLGFKDVS